MVTLTLLGYCMDEKPKKEKIKPINLLNIDRDYWPMVIKLANQGSDLKAVKVLYGISPKKNKGDEAD